MHRRDFLKRGAHAAVVGAAVSVSASPSRAGASLAALPKASPILKSYTADDHRRRLRNIGICELGIRSCMRRHLVTDYLPAQ